MNEVKLTKNVIKAIESVLIKGNKAEVIPGKHGIIVKRIKQETVLEPKKEYNTGA